MSQSAAAFFKDCKKKKCTQDFWSVESVLQCSVHLLEGHCEPILLFERFVPFENVHLKSAQVFFFYL